MGVQEWIAIAIAALAALYLSSRLTGFPRRRPKPPPVNLGSRLERGLSRARKR